MKSHWLPANFRTLLGMRKRRALMPTGPKPRHGARIHSGDVRLTVPAEMSDDLWQWLSSLGWREVTFRPDRRRYRDVPHAWAKHLFEARPEQRARVLLKITAVARARTPHPEAFREANLKRQAHPIP